MRFIFFIVKRLNLIFARVSTDSIYATNPAAKYDYLTSNDRSGAALRSSDEPGETHHAACTAPRQAVLIQRTWRWSVPQQPPSTLM
jgi:hypothetical protein